MSLDHKCGSFQTEALVFLSESGLLSYEEKASAFVFDCLRIEYFVSTKIYYL
jgi:hypothetical protein